MAKDTLSLREALSSPNDFSAGFRVAEELAKAKLRVIAARILATVVNADDAVARQEIVKLVEELRANDLSLTELDIELPSTPAVPPEADPPAS